MGSMRAAIGVRQPSFGVFSTVLQPTYRYGIPTNVKLAGVSVDVDASFTSVMAFNGDAQRTRELVEQNGIFASALEHEVPEKYFATEAQPRQGASAVSALAQAVVANQNVFSINRENFGLVRPFLSQSAEVLGDIQAAVDAGMEVIISQSQVGIDGWTGAGYIIQDPATGSGAYRISGGQNGGAMNSDVSDGLAMLGLGVVGAFFIPNVAASPGGGCDDDDGARRQVQMDWKLILTMALIMMMLLALLGGTGGVGGVVLGTAARRTAAKLIAAVLAAFAPLAAYAGGGSGGCAKFYIGTFTTTGSMAESTAHISVAIAGGRKDNLTYTGPDDGNSRWWLSGTFECNDVAKAAFAQHTSTVPNCDEFPFSKTWQGGLANYEAGNVSLLLINASHNFRAGGVFRSFIALCNIQANSRFTIIPTAGLSRGEDSRGNSCYRGVP